MKNMEEVQKSDEEKDLKKIFESEKHLAKEPFFFNGTNGKGILLVHGWTCTPYEVRKLGEYLNSKGYTVYGLLLSGHGTKPEDLEGVKWQQWMVDVERGYGKLKETCGEIYLGGTSLGAILTIIFAKNNKSLSGIVLMATPYKLKQEWLIDIISRSSLLLGKRYWKKYYPKSFGSSGLVTRLISYQRYPTANGIESLKAIKEARKTVGDIKCPCFIFQSTHDHIVTDDSADNIFEKIGSEIKKKRMIERAYHTFIADINNEHVFHDIFEFLEEI